MLLVWGIELIVPTLLIVGVVTQIVIPLWKGTPVFPLVHKHRERKRLREAADALDKLRDEAEIKRLKEEAEILKGRLHI